MSKILIFLLSISLQDNYGMFQSQLLQMKQLIRLMLRSISLETRTTGAFQRYLTSSPGTSPKRCATMLGTLKADHSNLTIPLSLSSKGLIISMKPADYSILVSFILNSIPPSAKCRV